MPSYSENPHRDDMHKALTPLLFVICACMIFCGLGFWQIHRLQTKNQLITSMKSAILREASNFHGHQDHSNYHHNHKYIMSGRFKYGDSMFLYGPHPKDEGRHGYYVLTPFETNGTHVLVRRGWISPVNIETFMHQQQHIDHTADVRHVTAVLKKLNDTQHHNTHKNDNNRNIWFYIDIPAMSNFTKHDLEPNIYMVLMDGEPLSHHLAISTTDDIIQIENNHMVYAITWFALAIIIVLMYIIYKKSND